MSSNELAVPILLAALIALAILAVTFAIVGELRDQAERRVYRQHLAEADARERREQQRRLWMAAFKADQDDAAWQEEFERIVRGGM